MQEHRSMTKCWLRINENDISVPVEEDGFWYYRKTEEEKPYSIYCRKKGSLEAEEEIILDQNDLAQDSEYFSLGGFFNEPRSQSFGIFNRYRRK